MHSNYIANKYNEKSREYCMLFFKNVDFVLSSKGISKESLVRQLALEGFKVNRNTIGLYKRGVYWSAKVGYLLAYCGVLQVSLEEMLSRDMESEARLGE